MSRSNYFFTSESVSEGHPDKICDQISDAIVDAYIEVEPESRVGVETLTTTNRIVLAGEVRGPEEILNKIEDIARTTVKSIGYEQEGFHWKNAEVEIYVHNQSPDIAQGVDAIGNKDEGAGDQGLMFGYACRETSELMPAPIFYSHKILRLLADARHSGGIKGIKPDSKSQVTLEYRNGQPVEASSIVLSTQHDEDLSQEEIRSIVEPYVIKALPEGWMCNEKNFFVNPTGKFVIGGPDGDAGLTGRKIIVDTYGGAAPHGGGAFSGKDPTKVDRSAAYAARYLAKNIVASNFADRCSIQLSYAIGVSHPLSVYVDTYGTGHVSDDKIEKVIKKVMDLTPRGIREHLQLNRPIYKKTATYGHFGREPEQNGSFSWEKLDLVDELKSNLS
ncbi:MAG: S-adenosylmethionine synthase [Alphaproteobacteria bacterium MarineAlpha2_Bin1]|nr:MAG: S-adenosylmethionine synthase [Alphaproteobacteria bacterium MarineAlpha2_Bin1]|tara:strand:+ start:1245 stop:2411 length:1167 start_codon:yes stop_codon:yes gene_type:complete